jgi:hypothetical protein
VWYDFITPEKRGEGNSTLQDCEEEHFNLFYEAVNNSIPSSGRIIDK